ncbi:MAG: hypothetical protein JNL32_08100, partial [Candidatus Kapabacteria bacterium]|nr:hypothetical protein [Candidatus Kapabacteria bacterium]
SDASGVMSWTTALTGTTGWQLAGNAPVASWNGTTGSFIGTTNAQPLSIATTNATAQDIAFFTGASGANERMRILGNGNIGIGTITPNAALQFGNVIGNRRIVLWEDNNNDHQFYGLGVNASILRYQVGNTSASHVFYAGTTSSASNELMRIGGNGNIGIGTSSPTTRLHVNGTSRFAGGNMLIDTSAASTAGQLQLMNPARTFQTNLQAGAQTANITYTLPTAAPTVSGQVLTATTAGVMSWVTSGATVTHGVNSPTAYASNQNNLALVSGGNSLYRISASSAIDITGLVADADGRQITIVNVGSNAITLKVQSASSTAGNRFILRSNGDAVLNTDDMITLVYDNTTGRWREMNRSF